MSLITGGGRAYAAAPTVGAVTNSDPSGAGVGRYKKFELSFPVTTAASNLYLPYDSSTPSYAANLKPLEDARNGVSVDGLFLPPGQTDWAGARVQPGFLYRDYVHNDPLTGGQFVGSRQDCLVQNSPDSWRVRFAPDVVGTWQYRLRVTDAGGTVLTDATSFQCVASDSKGFVRVSSTDSRYFQFDDGTPFLPLGGHFGASPSTPRACALTGEQELAQKLKTSGAYTLDRVWLSGQGFQVFGGFNDGNEIQFNVGSPNQLTARDAHTGRFCLSIPNGQRLECNAVSVKPNTAYVLTAWVKMVDTTSTGDTHSCNLVSFGDFDHQTKTTLTPGADWVKATLSFTSGNPAGGQNFFQQFSCYFVNGSAGGNMLIDDVTLTEGATGLDALEGHGRFESHATYNQRQAWMIDQIVSQREQAGQYVRLNCMEKNSRDFMLIQGDGTNAGGFNGDNFYGASNDPNADLPVRRLQRYWARYVMARWGYSTAVAQFEAFNEGDPYSGYMHACAQNFGKAIHAYGAHGRRPHSVSSYNVGGNRQYPISLYENSTLPDIDFADEHFYANPSDYAPYTPDFPYRAWQLTPNGGPAGTGSLRLYAGHDTPSSGASIPLIRVRGQGTWTVKVGMRTSPDAQFNDFRFQVEADSPLNNTSGQGVFTRLPYMDGEPNTKPNSTGAVYTRTFTLADDAPHNANIGPYVYTGESLKTGWVEVYDVQFIAPDGSLFAHYTFNEPSFFHDTASLVHYMGLLRNTYSGAPGIRKPYVISECSIMQDGGSSNYMTNPGNDLSKDTTGVAGRMAYWSQVCSPGAALPIWWDFTNNVFMPYSMPAVAAAQAFIAGVPVANGNYRNVDAATSDPSLLVIGQKDVVNGRAHLYVYNRQNDWYKMATAAVSLASLSGTVTVAGLPDGDYKVQTWDTSLGRITAAQTLTSRGGALAVPVTNLKCDVAFKIAPLTAPALSVRLDADKKTAKPGDTVTYTVTYANTGTAEADNVTLPCPIPAQTTFLSADNGGTYNSAKSEVDFSLGTVPAGATGSVTFRVKVN